MRTRHVRAHTVGMRGVWLGAAALLALCGTACAQAHDPATYEQPRARCVRPVPGRVLTRVGSFPGGDGTPLEVVSVVTLRPPDAYGLVEFGAPTVSVFDRHCRLVWRQAYDEVMADVGFRTLTLPGGAKALHVVAISLFEPVDQKLAQEALLVVRHGRLVPFGPDVLGGSRFYSSFVGRLPGTRGFAIVTEENDTQVYGSLPPELLVTHVRRYQPSRHPGAVGTWLPPETLDWHGAQALHLPDVPPHPAFPLCRYTFGYGRFSGCVPSEMVVPARDLTAEARDVPVPTLDAPTR